MDSVWSYSLLAVIVGVVCATSRAFGQEGSNAGKQASGIVVKPRPTPEIVEGNAGIAARYRGDIGIENDPDVVFVATFEGSVDEICSRWESVSGEDIMTTSDETPPGSGGKQSLLVTRPEGTLQGGHLYRRLENDQGGYGYDQLYYRFYMKFNKEHDPIHHYGGAFWGLNPPTPHAQGGAGVRPAGDKRWITQIEPGGFQRWHNYTYWQHMGGSPPRGQTWGNSFEHNMPLPAVPREQWICLELMVKMNDIGDTNGEMAWWVDGKIDRDAHGRIIGYQGKGFPSSGTWTYDKFEPYVSKEGIAFDYEQGKGVPIEGGKPFPGFEWRTVPELNANAIWLYRYMSKPETGTSKVWWDHVVVARKYIGPMTPVGE